MISDLITTNSDRALISAAMGETGMIQPVRDVQAYLRERTPQPEISGEENLLITLPAKLQTEVRTLVRACKFVADLVRKKFSVQAACKQTLTVFSRWGWKLGTFRMKYDLWAEKCDWVVLVNLAKAPAAWKTTRLATMPPEFLDYVEQQFGRFAREDGKRQALLAIQRHWRTGRDESGNECAIAGYENAWNKRDREVLPMGWSYSNITRQIKKRNRFNKATRALLHESESAAREFLPHHLGTRKHLRFLEKVTFDDVRMDWLVFNTATQQAEELWLLLARDEATAMALGFVEHPATVREDGKASHLGARQMKELAAYLLERYPLPPYTVHWIVERGTATLRESVQAALAELFNERIKVHYTSMIGGLSPTGYAEKRKGNSRGKASHESHNRLIHTMAAHLPGQTGANWGIRPADLDARVRECQAISEMARHLPEEKRGEVEYPLLTLSQARAKLQEIFTLQNFRKEHNLEGFDQIVVEEGGRLIQRLEMPVERAVRLIRSVDRWDKVSPDIVRTFLEHTQRHVTVNQRGEVELLVNGRKLTFCAPAAELGLIPGQKALAYHHPADPQFLHLTSGDGRILGTWCQRGRTPYLDQQTLSEAMRYTHAARAEAVATAADLAAPQREQLEAMRARNAELEKFVVVTDAPAANGELPPANVGTVLTNVSTQIQTHKHAAKQREKDLRSFDGSAEDLLEETNTEATGTDDEFSADGLL